MLIFAALLLGASVSPLFGPPEPGVRRYTYQAAETVNGAPGGGYRMDFRLETDADGAIDAVIETTGAVQANGSFAASEIAEDCRARLHAPAGGLARVRLWPLAEADKDLGPSFLDACAPAALFFPLTDILNVVLVLRAPRFGASRLKRVGQVANYPAFTARFERLGQNFMEASNGGLLRWVSRKDQAAVLEWAPNPADLTIIRSGAQGVTLTGKEHWAFRVKVRSPGLGLISAKTTVDDLDLRARPAGVNPANAFPVHIHRDVAITPR